MVATATRTRKPAPPVQVRPLDVGAGLYSALSSDGTTWYLVDVKDRTCTCPAGARGFAHCKAGACRHLIAARVIARGLASMAPAARAAALRLVNFRVHVERVDLAQLDAPLARHAAAPAAAQLALAA
jgi:hypothetical protein